MAADAAGDKMLALTFGGTEQIVLSTVDKPRILQPTDVIVKVTLCGICGR
jgi:threonine dehydrogenase-like Zn-dependent dehydrogenase